ncbi:MAG: bifunctional methylenetetrahydrofolate dehydrogenase/methenyltetrahydrofolate cyclohydrolase FolD [Clostridiales bacterium]|nr:bifunctional methylenetetrahydrofolate dehydrogenase/methenyltetrahydrofolate cyclohydrolase FolD [Clostridiales bacterium]
MTVVIDGKKVAAQIKSQLNIEVEEFKRKGGECGLAVIIVGENPASKIYVRNKIASCVEVGIKSYHYELPEEVDEEEVINLIEELNENKEVYGILVQLPLPKKFNERRVLAAINPEKDVDGFSSYQMGKLVLGEECFPSCTPRGIIELLHAYNIPLEGKRAVVVGRSNTVGKPMAIMLLKENATVTVAHSKTQNLGELTLQADILVVAIGKAKFIKENMVKEGAVVIDVGMNRVDGKLCGDVDFEAVKNKCSYITPVPGGVGPMTVTMLLKNTVDAARRNG